MYFFEVWRCKVWTGNVAEQMQRITNDLQFNKKQISSKNINFTGQNRSSIANFNRNNADSVSFTGLGHSKLVRNALTSRLAEKIMNFVSNPVYGLLTMAVLALTIPRVIVDSIRHPDMGIDTGTYELLGLANNYGVPEVAAIGGAAIASKATSQNMSRQVIKADPGLVKHFGDNISQALHKGEQGAVQSAIEEIFSKLKGTSYTGKESKDAAISFTDDINLKKASNYAQELAELIFDKDKKTREAGLSALKNKIAKDIGGTEISLEVQRKGPIASIQKLLNRGNTKISTDIGSLVDDLERIGRSMLNPPKGKFSAESITKFTNSHLAANTLGKGLIIGLVCFIGYNLQRITRHITKLRTGSADFEQFYRNKYPAKTGAQKVDNKVEVKKDDKTSKLESTEKAVVKDTTVKPADNSSIVENKSETKIENKAENKTDTTKTQPSKNSDKAKKVSFGSGVTFLNKSDYGIIYPIGGAGSILTAKGDERREKIIKITVALLNFLVLPGIAEKVAMLGTDPNRYAVTTVKKLPENKVLAAIVNFFGQNIKSKADIEASTPKIAERLLGKKPEEIKNILRKYVGKDNDVAWQVIEKVNGKDVPKIVKQSMSDFIKEISSLKANENTKKKAEEKLAKVLNHELINVRLKISKAAAFAYGIAVLGIGVELVNKIITDKKMAEKFAKQRAQLSQGIQNQVYRVNNFLNKPKPKAS